MAKLSSIKTDLSKVADGVWVTYGDTDIELLIASTESRPYKRARDRLMKPHLRQVRKRMTGEEILDVIKPAVAKHILLDWRNLQDDDGQLISYSPEKAMEFFENPALGDFYTFILEVAGETAMFRQQDLEDAAGN
jgi:hypothetical protein